LSSIIRATNLRDNRTVELRINDRKSPRNRKPLRMCVEKSKSGDAKPLNVYLIAWGIESFTLRETFFLLPRHAV